MKAFTLIELLIVIVIIGILAAFLLTNIGKTSIEQARDAKRLFDVQNVRLGLTLYYSDKQSYPASLSLLVPKYIPVVPTDPKDNQAGCGELSYDPDGFAANYQPGDYGYRYTQLGQGKGYLLQTCLENSLNPALGSDASNPSSGVEYVYDIGVQP
ncbi:MAG: prepilin-type N-terminal cleavage/methylation domain-containing protein [Candidatus Portnoybacteria bacterium]|nr:prepilin-type N-terminal cleavage/methylation domain-containing protein [Candidatus Portnoybacteria bacterium]